MAEHRDRWRGTLMMVGQPAEETGGGAVAMLRLTGEITSLSALVGAIILSGSVVNSGIILIEYIGILRERGVDKTEAIVQASVRKVRSVMITSLSAILGMLPLAIGQGEGTELYRGVAAVMLGGLLVSTPLTLVVLPLLYSLMEGCVDFLSTLGFRLSVILGTRR